MRSELTWLTVAKHGLLVVLQYEQDQTPALVAGNLCPFRCIALQIPNFGRYVRMHGRIARLHEPAPPLFVSTFACQTTATKTRMEKVIRIQRIVNKIKERTPILSAKIRHATLPARLKPLPSGASFAAFSPRSEQIPDSTRAHQGSFSGCPLFCSTHRSNFLCCCCSAFSRACALDFRR